MKLSEKEIVPEGPSSSAEDAFIEAGGVSGVGGVSEVEETSEVIVPVEVSEAKSDDSVIVSLVLVL